MLQIINKIYLISCLALLFGFVSNTVAQEIVLQVVTKSVEKTFPYQTGNELIVEGEKAEIKIITWDNPEIHVSVDVVSKHPERITAEADLEKMNLELAQKGVEIVIRNFVNKDDKEGVVSNIRAKYTIKVPAECPVVLDNYFGHAVIQDLDNSLYLNSEFTTIGLNNIKGKVGIQTRFGDIAGEAIEGDVNITAHRSNITLSRLGGTFNIDAKYGTLKIYAEQSNINLNINAEKSDVYFFDTTPSFYNYDLQAHNGVISVPNLMDFDFEEKSQQVQRASFKPSDELGGVRVAINVSFGEIKIGGE